MDKTAAVMSRLRISNNGELKEICGLCSNITPLDIEKGVKGKSQQLEKSQAMISFKLFSQMAILFSKLGKITIRLTFLAIYLLCEFDEPRYNISSFRAS